MFGRRRSRAEPPTPSEPPAEPPAEAVLTAAVAKLDMTGAGWRTWRIGDREWQREAWRLYDITGPLRFIGNWVGNSVSRARLYVANVNESGEPDGEASDERVAALAAGPLGRGPAKDEALRLLGINLFIPGEGYVIAESEGNPDGSDRWWVVSGRQIARTGDQITIARSQLHGGGKFVYRDGLDLIIRCWTPHPADTDEPDSPTRSAIPDLREIEAIRKREFAELDSRLTGAGLLPLPEGCDFPRGPNDPPGVQGFGQLLMRAMGTSLQDRASAEAMVPIMFTVPGEYVDKIRPINFWSELSDQLLPLREAAVKSLAQSLDTPPEILLGLGSTNHWSAWAISEEAVTTQIVPILSRIADALTIGYLHGALEELGLDPDAYCYAFDTAPLTTRPNRSADALNYHDKLLLSDEAARTAGAWGDQDKPDTRERLRRLAEQAVFTNPALLQDQGIRDLIGLTGPPPAGPVDDGSPRQPELPPADTTDPRSIPDQTPQTEEPTGQPAALLVAAGLSIRRALTLAGSRLVPHRYRDRWPDTPRHELHTRHGLVTRDRAEEVLRGAWDDLPDTAADLCVDPDHLRELLHGFAVELLVRGLPYDRMMLRDLLAAAPVPELAGCP